MPKVKTALRAIPRIYRQQALDSIMFGYVWAMRRTMPHLSMTQILEWFHKDFELDEDNYPIDGAKVVFNRCFKNFRNAISENRSD